MNATDTATPERTRLRGVSVASVAVVLGLMLSLAACGHSREKGTTADPASVIPASTPVFASAAVRPRGKLQKAATLAGQQLTHRSRPYAGLIGALRTPGSPTLDYARDVAPWLGRHAGAFVTSAGGAETLARLLLAGAGQVNSFPFAANGPQGAIVMDTSEPSAAQKFLDAAATHAGARPTAYKGVTYQATPAGIAFALVERFAVIGTEAAVREVIDTAEGGSSLAKSSGYSKLNRNAPEQSLARLYLASGAGGAHGARGAGASGAVQALLGLVAPSATSLTSLEPTDGSLALSLDAIAPAGSPGLFEAAPDGAQAFSELPGESWLGLGIGNAKARLGPDIRGLGTLLGLGGSEGESSIGGLGSLLGALLKPLQVLTADTPQARSDYAGWIGPVGVFASGGNILELKGAVVIDSLDASRSSAAVAKLAAQLHGQGASVSRLTLPGTEAAAQVRLSGFPLPLVIAAGPDGSGQPKFVLGLGPSSVALALQPPSTLGSSPRGEAAASALGEGIKPSLVLAVPSLLSLLEGLGLTESGGLASVVPYLRSATTLSGGAYQLNREVERVKLVLGLAGSGGG